MAEIGLTPVSYAKVVRKSAGNSDELDTTTESSPQLPINSDPSASKSGEPQKKKRAKKSKAARKAAKALQAEAEKEQKISESSETDETKVYIDAPPPKVNPWLSKKEAEQQQPLQEQEINATDEKPKQPPAASVIKESTAANRITSTTSSTTTTTTTTKPSVTMPPKKSITKTQTPTAPTPTITAKPLAPIIVTTGSGSSPWKTAPTVQTTNEVKVRLIFEAILTSYKVLVLPCCALVENQSSLHNLILVQLQKCVDLS
jgi:hypothetical protein